MVLYGKHWLWPRDLGWWIPWCLHCRLIEILSVSIHWFWTKIIHSILNFPWVLFKPIYSSKQQEAEGYFIEFIVSFFVERPVFTGFHCDLTTFLCSLYSFSLSPISGGDYFIVLKKGEPTQWDLQRHSVSKPQIICLPLLSPPLIAGKSFLLHRTSPCNYQELPWIGLIHSCLQKYFSLSFISSHFWLIIFSWLDYFHYTCMINTYHLIEGSPASSSASSSFLHFSSKFYSQASWKYCLFIYF